MSFEQEPVSQVFIAVLDLKADHQPASPVLLERMYRIPARAECVPEIFAYLGRILYQMLAFNDFQDCNGCGSCQVVASESGAEHSVFRLECRGYQYTSDREAVRHPLCSGDNVCPDAGMLVRKELSCTSVS